MSKTALITGASAGIGYELSNVFAKNGYDLVLVSRNRQKLGFIAGNLESSYNVHVIVMPKDLCKPAAPQELYDEIADKGIDIDVLVNNAGIGVNGKFTDFSIERYKDLIQLNITSLTMLCKLFGSEMVKKKSGRILNVASTASFQAGPLMGSYYASKAYVLSLSEALNYELGQDRVVVTALCPGPTQTEFFERNDMIGVNVTNCPWMMKAAEVAEAGFSGLMKGKTIVIPGLINKLLVFSVRFVPRRIPAAMVCYLNKRQKT